MWGCCRDGIRISVQIKRCLSVSVHPFLSNPGRYLDKPDNKELFRADTNDH
ncbi:6564_t:CDS:1, partial [Racocetra persica]